MRKNAKKYLGLILMFLVGLSILLYPTVSNIWNQYRDSLLISKYDSVVSSDTESDQNAEMWKAAEEYNKQIKQESVPDAFSVRDGQTDHVYESLLNLNGDGMMGYVEVPVIGQSIPIYHYTTEEISGTREQVIWREVLFRLEEQNTHCCYFCTPWTSERNSFLQIWIRVRGWKSSFYLHVLGQTLALRGGPDIRRFCRKKLLHWRLPKMRRTYVTLINLHTIRSQYSTGLLVRGHRIPYEEAKEIVRRQRKQVLGTC